MSTYTTGIKYVILGVVVVVVVVIVVVVVVVIILTFCIVSVLYRIVCAIRTYKLRP